MGALSEAADLLRAHIAALPESDQRPWHDGGKKGVVDSDGLTIFNSLSDYAIAPHRALVALTASPDRVEMLAALLEHMGTIYDAYVSDGDEDVHGQPHVVTLALVLAASITGQDGAR